MAIPVAGPKGQPVRRMLSYGRHHINQYCCRCHKREIKLWGKVVPLLHLGYVVVRRLYLLCLLLGWHSRYVRF